MNNELFQFILNKEHIEYAIFDIDFCMIEKSDDLSKLFNGNRSVEIGDSLFDVFFELVGFEETLNEVLNGKKESIGIDWIGESNQSQFLNNEKLQIIKYFNLKVLQYNRGLVVILKNVSEEGDLEQTVYRRLNELDLLSNQLVEDLKYSNKELNIAYKSTIEGWAKALELRDVETKGHSVRVAEYTIHLAKEVGVQEEEFDNYYFGALMHDIGKMGIPDRILLKPSPLDADEWAIMRMHPIYANRLLSSIKHPKFSLDIPTYHHEKWDGTGYPFGLNGTEIPLSARVFTVIDVFDGLTSDRPYRKAWPVDTTINHIKGKSGISFDPFVVEKFLEIFLHRLPLPELSYIKISNKL